MDGERTAVTTAWMDLLGREYNAVSPSSLKQFLVLCLQHCTSALHLGWGVQAQRIQLRQLLWEAKLVRLEVELETVRLSFAHKIGDDRAQSRAALAVRVTRGPDCAAVAKVLVIDIVLYLLRHKFMLTARI